jgi:hypothetical protein
MSSNFISMTARPRMAAERGARWAGGWHRETHVICHYSHDVWWRLTGEALGLTDARHMNYSVVFDSTRSSYTFIEYASRGGTRYAFAAVSVLLVVATVVLIATRHRLGKLVVTAGLACFVGLWLLASHWLLPKVTVWARTVNPTVITGIVRDFVPMPPEGHMYERFCVETVCFYYSDYEITGGFNHTSSHGGPIREGLSVRVTYAASATRNVILKLEVGQ